MNFIIWKNVPNFLIKCGRKVASDHFYLVCTVRSADSDLEKLFIP